MFTINVLLAFRLIGFVFFVVKIYDTMDNKGIIANEVLKNTYLSKVSILKCVAANPAKLDTGPKLLDVNKRQIKRNTYAT